MKVSDMQQMLSQLDPDAEVICRNANGTDVSVEHITAVVLPDISGLTPTEDLLLELLVARTRLGHDWWTIASNTASRKAAGTLVERGVISTLHGTVEGTFRARLTPAQRVAIDLDSTYVPPILGGLK